MIRATFAAAALAALSLLPWSAAPAAAQDIDTSTIAEMAIGAEDAPVTVIEYASFTCPHCATFHEGVYPDLKRDYIDTGKVRFVMREVYFDRFGLWASMVARCGGEERYFGIVDRIFETQRDWTQGGDPAAIADRLRRIGLSAGIGEEDLQACLTDAEKAQTLVTWYEENAETHGIDSTPSFVIDGETFGNMGYDRFSEIIDARLPADG